jgi:glutathione synthase/RimK-type ligase-like ATP-grasp enzyme/gamma-glutamyl:cysteine ligase YbdK (ATP-grasp superfamily)
MAGERRKEGGARVKQRRILCVVSEDSDGVDLPSDSISADRYLAGGQEFGGRETVVLNLCRSYRYRSKGYYVSLLADARGQRVLPSVETIEGMAEPFGLFRSLEEAALPTVDPLEMKARWRALVAEERSRGGGDTESHRPRRGSPLVRAKPAEGSSFRSAGAGETARVYALFGECDDRRFAAAARAVYREWPVPILELEFLCEDGEWKVTEVEPVPLHQLPGEDRARLRRLLESEPLVLRRAALVPREETRASVAVLVDAADLFSPSTPETIERLERVGARLNVHVRRIGLDDAAKLGEYDALFIRALTGVREPAFQFALRAEALGMPVIDDTQSIIRCSNKVFLEELLRREGIPTPRTLVLTARTPWNQIVELGDPFVIKLPDSSFSAAVHKVSSQAEYRKHAAEMFRQSPLIIAQEYLPTEYDWRITVLGGKVLFAARYYMARGHWQIRTENGGSGEDYGQVEAVPRERAPRAVVELAVRAATLMGDGLYGVDIKETPRGPVVIEINDNPNLDRGEEDVADGDAIYEDILQYFLRRIEETAENGAGEERGSRLERRAGVEARRHYRPFEVAGMELEYAVVDQELNVVSLVEDAFRSIAGRPTSDVELDGFGFSNEIADHVFELKTLSPTPSLQTAEELLVTGVRRFSEVLRERHGARLLPTGMHPWMDPRQARLWSRSNAAIYQTYARIFDVKTHGWMNVHAAHLNLPLGREEEGVALYNAAALLVPYLPALAASSPVFAGRLQSHACGRMAWILEHQARLPESQGQIVPEYIESFADYRKRILAPMYAALDDFEDAGRLRQEFLNARGAVIRFARKALEIRVVDMQECVRLDVAIAVFVRSVLRSLTRRLLSGKLALPAHALLVADLRATIQAGSVARVVAPHLGDTLERDAAGTASARDVLRELLDSAQKSVRRDEAPYLDVVERVIEAGSLSERIRAALEPHERGSGKFRRRLQDVYAELADCLERNEPWPRRWL